MISATVPVKESDYRTDVPMDKTCLDLQLTAAEDPEVSQRRMGGTLATAAFHPPKKNWRLHDLADPPDCIHGRVCRCGFDVEMEFCSCRGTRRLSKSMGSWRTRRKESKFCNSARNKPERGSRTWLSVRVLFDGMYGTALRDQE